MSIDVDKIIPLERFDSKLSQDTIDRANRALSKVHCFGAGFLTIGALILVFGIIGTIAAQKGSLPQWLHRVDFLSPLGSSACIVTVSVGAGMLGVGTLYLYVYRKNHRNYMNRQHITKVKGKLAQFTGKSFAIFFDRVTSRAWLLSPDFDDLKVTATSETEAKSKLEAEIEKNGLTLKQQLTLDEINTKESIF